VQEVKSIIQQTANVVDEVKCSLLQSLAFLAAYTKTHILTGNQLKQLLRAWLSLTDPSTNHNIARKAQYKGTAIWFFQGSIFIEWKSTGSLLWVHGKSAFFSALFGLAPPDRLWFWQLERGKASSGLLLLSYILSRLILCQFLRH
jgi:hypothetical protein